MTSEQVQHIESLLESFRASLKPKYTKGAEEHGGNLWDMSEGQLLDNAIEETIDQFTYLMTLKQKLEGKH